MKTDNILLIVVLFSIGLGLLVHHLIISAPEERNPMPKPAYEEVQRAVDRQVRWAGVAAIAFGALGVAACFIGRLV